MQPILLKSQFSLFQFLAQLDLSVSGAEGVGGLRRPSDVRRPASGVRRQDLGKKPKAFRVLGLALSNLACMCIKPFPTGP